MWTTEQVTWIIEQVTWIYDGAMSRPRRVAT